MSTPTTSKKLGNLQEKRLTRFIIEGAEPETFTVKYRSSPQNTESYFFPHKVTQ